MAELAGSCHDHGNCELCDYLDAEREAMILALDEAHAGEIEQGVAQERARCLNLAADVAIKYGMRAAAANTKTEALLERDCEEVAQEIADLIRAPELAP